MKSEWKYTPNPHKNPCYKDHHCKNFEFGCKNECDDWALFLEEKEKHNKEKIRAWVDNDYKTASQTRMLRRCNY